jgi:CHAD domain-containing protein
MSSDLLLPDGTTVQAATAALERTLRLRPRAEEDTERTFYDTVDGLLHGAGLSVVHEHAELGLVSLNGSRRPGPRTAWAAAPRRVLAIELDDGQLRDELVPVVGVRALTACARIHSRARAFDVLNTEDKTVVRLTVEQPTVIASGERLVPLGPRVRMTAVRGYDKQLERTRRRLERELGFREAERSLVDDAVLVSGRDPAGSSSKVAVELSFEQRTDSAVVAVLGALRVIIESNIDGTIADIDAEFLHDFRVAVRRSRTVQRQCRRAFPAAELRRLRSEFRWVQRATGDARDLDVYVLEFEQMRTLVPEPFRRDLDPLLAVLRARRLSARREMVSALRSARARALWRDWAVLLDGLQAMPVQDRPAAATPIGKLAGKRISKLYRRMVKMGRAIDADSPSGALHELRKQGKELRYMLELFGAQLYPSEHVKPMVKSLKSLQNLLGRHQDREVQAAMLRSLRDDVAAQSGGAAALMAMGLLVERVAEDQRAAREELAERFSAFASKQQRKLVRETFA